MICHQIRLKGSYFSIGRTAPLLNPPQSPRCYAGRGRMTMRKKFPPPLAMLPNPVLSCLSSHSDPIVLEPFDVTLWYSGVSRTPNLLKILKVISEMTFSANCAQVWKLNRISMTIINKVARKCIRCCQNVQRCLTAPQKGEGGLCSGSWKGGQDSHVGMFSLCVAAELIPSASIFTSGRQMTIPVARQSQDCIRQLGIPSCRGSNLEIGTIPGSRSTADRCMEPLNCHPRGSSCYKCVVVSVLSGVTCLALFSNLLDSTKFSSESISLSTVPHIFVFFFPDWFKSLRAVTLLLLTYIIPLIIEAEHRAHYRRRLLPWEVLELPS